MPDNQKIAVVGSGYVGLVAAACLAKMRHDVICVDNDERKVAALQGGDTLIHENHLPELLHRYRNTQVRFTSDLAEATTTCDSILIAVGTPRSETGDADLSYVEAVACEIARHIATYKVIVEKSTVPVYTNEWMSRAIERNGVARDLFDVVSNSEFLREGTAVVGADSERAATVLKAIYAPLTTGSYYEREDTSPTAAAPPRLLHTSTKSAEIIKYALNAFLALKLLHQRRLSSSPTGASLPTSISSASTPHSATPSSSMAATSTIPTPFWSTASPTSAISIGQTRSQSPESTPKPILRSSPHSNAGFQHLEIKQPKDKLD